MSTRQTGNRHENAVMEMAEALGYACFAARGSRGPVDIICFQDVLRLSTVERYVVESLLGDATVDILQSKVPLVIQVGTTNKPITSTLAELAAAPRPIGSLCVVARRHKHKTSKRISWTFHTENGKFESLAVVVGLPSPTVQY